MTEPHLDSKKPKGIAERLFHGRGLGPLLGPWLGCLIATALVFVFEYEMPAFHEFVKIFYFVIAVVFIIATARYMRPRGTGNRRTGERRVHDRRQDERPD
jgi:hypothetical protein